MPPIPIKIKVDHPWRYDVFETRDDARLYCHDKISEGYVAVYFSMNALASVTPGLPVLPTDMWLCKWHFAFKTGGKRNGRNGG